MNRTTKKQVVTDLRESISTSSVVIVAHYKGLTVQEITDLRRKLRANGAAFLVTKNTLARLAVKETQYAALDSLFEGPTAVAYANDPVAAAKGVVEYAKKNEKLVILGGAVNSQVMDVASIQMLATLPSLDELRAKILGLISAPATRIAGVLQAPAGQIARVIRAYSNKE